MNLVDTSVWVDHLRAGEPALAEMLEEGRVAIHPLIIEELACGRLSNRDELIDLLESLPKAPSVSHSEFLEFIARHELHGAGLGAVDVHLLASARLDGLALWTRDAALSRAAKRLGVPARKSAA